MQICETRSAGEMEYRIVRSRRRTVSLTVARTGEVIVRAPIGYSSAKIREFVLRHTDWVEKRISERKAVTLDLSAESKITLFGKEYLLARGKTAISGDTVTLPEENTEAAFADLLKKLTQAVMGGMTERIARDHGFVYDKVRASTARSRWGSCSRKGCISYTFRNAFLPAELAEYVCVHELCHTQYFNHGAAFWKRVESVMPDYKIRRKKLKACGNFMNLL